MNTVEEAVKEQQRKRRIVQARQTPVREGEHWNFVTAAGETRRYVVENVEADELGLAGLVTLTNLETHKRFTGVTRKWLHDPPGPTGSYWFPEEKAA